MKAGEAAPATVDGLSQCFVGVKPFERALVQLISSAEISLPTCCLHPLLPGEDGICAAEGVIWQSLHAEVHPAGKAAGGALPAARVERKCWQLESLIALAGLLSEGLREARDAPEGEAEDSGACHLVDFAGGCGPLGLPLAALMPRCIVTIVELKKRSLDIARGRAAAAGLSNVRFFEGDLSSFAEPFDVGLALHACGTASDLVLQACVAARACFVVCPCCTGKLSSARQDVYRFTAAGSNELRVPYPRSKAVAATLTPSEYDFLACAADVSDEALLRGRRGMLRRLCKAYLEHDRALWAAEERYDVRVTRMHEPRASPKMDILLGWPSEAPPSARVSAPVVPPENFAMVWRGIYRSSYPSKRNFGFLQKLQLRTILYLCPEEYPELNVSFMQEHGVQLLQIGVDGNKEPFGEIPMPLIRRALTAVLDPQNQPLLIHCNQGKHRTGCLVGCLRKLQQWSLVSIFEEYRRFSGSKARVVDQLFIERFSMEDEGAEPMAEGDQPEEGAADQHTSHASAESRKEPKDKAGKEPKDKAGKEPKDKAGKEPKDKAGKEPKDKAGVEPKDKAGKEPKSAEEPIRSPAAAGGGAAEPPAEPLARS